MSNKSFFLLLTVSLILCIPLYADTIPGGDVSGRWYQANSPYYITGDIAVPAGDTLTIEPGVDIIFLGLYRLTVSGRLIATGTIADSIRFYPQDTLTGWQGLYYYATGAYTQGLNYCVIEHARESGVYIQATFLTLNISDCTIANCRSQLGGGVHGHGFGSKLNIRRSSICFNTAEADTGGRGGGIFLFYGKLKMDSCIIHANRAVIPTHEEYYSARGGGIYFCHSSLCDTINSSLFSDNFIGLSNGGQSGGEQPSWTDGGVAIYNDSEQHAVILHCVFSGNIGNARFGEGGAIQATGLTMSTLISHCLFSDNRITSDNGLGSALHIQNGADIINCTFSRNGRYSVWLENGHVRSYTVCNSIFAFDTHGITFWNGTSDSTSVTYNDFMDECSSMPPGFGVLDTVNYNGDSCDVYGNIFMDPMFADTASGDYHLTAGSPCIDAGNPAFDYDPDGTIPDMGAYYFDQRTPEIELPVVVLDFDTVTVGDSSSLSFNIYNIGEGNLLLYDITNSLSVFTSDWNPLDSTILPGDSLGITVTFKPDDTLDFNDTLWIDNNDTPAYVELMGIGKPVSGISEDILVSPLLELCGTNPFYSRSVIRFGMPNPTKINLSVYDITGRCVKILAAGEYQAGINEVTFDGTALSQGVYFCVMKAGGSLLREKLILLE
jgi:hypothetical protein